MKLEYDPILGNVKSTRKRSSTLTTNLDNDIRRTHHRHQSVTNRYKILPSNLEHDNTPIWARHRTSHSTIKPSDLIREYDKKEKLDSTALRRLSRTGMKQITEMEISFIFVFFFVLSTLLSRFHR